jgi:hypothetical protein
MSYSPFYRVIVEGNKRDITDKISSISFEDSVDDLDVFTMKCIGLSLDDLDNIFVNGVILNVIFGYLGGSQSQKRTCKISNVNVTYGGIITANVVCLDLGIVLAKTKITKIWQGQSIKYICTKVAKDSGMSISFANDTNASINKKIDLITQTNQDNLSFVRGIIKEFADWKLTPITKDDKIIVKEKALSSPSIKTFNWNNGDGQVISFTPNEKDTSKSESSSETVANGYDLSNNESIDKSTTPQNNKEKKLNDFTNNYDVNANLNSRTRNIATEVKDSVYVPNTDATEVDNKSKYTQTESSLDDITANLVINGDPNIMADVIVTMKNVSKKHSGNWYVSKAKHSIDASYITTLELKRNATGMAQSGDSTKNDDINKSVGTDKTDNKIKVSKVINYDTNAIEL